VPSPHARHIETLDQLQNLERREALRVRRELARGVAAIGDRDRLHPFGPKRLEVAGAQGRPFRLEGPADPFGEFSVVEGARPLVRNPLQRAGQVVLHEPIALAQPAPAGKEDRGRRGVLREDRLILRDPVGERARDRQAVLRVVDRVVEEPLPRQDAVALVRFAPAVHGTGDGQGREAAPRRDLLFVSAIAVIVTRGFAGCGSARVQRLDTALFGIVDEPEPVAAQPRHVRVSHAEDGVGRDRRVHRASSFPEDLQAGGAREVV
jgi:hypothetical protein